eukprot:50950-Eustigmatos_ZCMA.PRE.1
MYIGATEYIQAVQRRLDAAPDYLKVRVGRSGDMPTIDVIGASEHQQHHERYHSHHRRHRHPGQADPRLTSAATTGAPSQAVLSTSPLS